MVDLACWWMRTCFSWPMRQGCRIGHDKQRGDLDQAKLISPTLAANASGGSGLLQR